MNDATTQAILDHKDLRDLMDAIRRRIQGRFGEQPVPGVTWTEAVSCAVDLSRAEPERTLFAETVLLVLDELVLAAHAGDLQVVDEWPAGLCRIVQQVSWHRDERQPVARRLSDLLRRARDWPIGVESAPGLDSPVLELHRAARALYPSLPFDVHEPSLVKSILRALKYGAEHGALLGIYASFGVVEPLWGLINRSAATRDAFDRELRRWKGDDNG